MEKKDFIIWASKLQADYRPSDEVLQKISKVDLLAIVGPTGVGKSTLIENLEIAKVLSDVSRDKRPGEKDDKDYHFRKDYLRIIEEIKKGNYVQFLVSSSGEFYGTHISAYPDEGLCTMAIYAHAIPLFTKVGFRSVKQAYIMPPSYIEWMHRIGGVRTKDLLMRIGEAKNSVEQALADESYSFILNDSLDYALRDIQSVINGEPVDNHREMLARGTADLLLERIGGEEV